MNTYWYLLGLRHIPSPIPSSSVLENIARQLTGNWSVLFLPNLRGLICNISVVTCLQNKSATLLYNLYCHSICHHVPFPPPALLQSPDGAWPDLANFRLPPFLFHPCPLLRTEGEELRFTDDSMSNLTPRCYHIPKCNQFWHVNSVLISSEANVCQHVQIISWSFGKSWFWIQILYKRYKNFRKILDMWCLVIA